MRAGSKKRNAGTMATPQTERALPPARKRLRTASTAPAASFDTGERVTLDPSELACILGRLMAAGSLVSDEPRTVESLTCWLWQELYRQDSDLARLTFSAAVRDGAPLDAVVAVAEVLTLEASIRPQRSTHAA